MLKNWKRNKKRLMVMAPLMALVLILVLSSTTFAKASFKKKTCHNSDGKKFTASQHVAKFKKNDSTVKKLREVVNKHGNAKQKKAALFALKAVGSYYCQEQRNTNGAYDCSSLVGRAYVSAGDNTFSSLPGTKNMLKKLKNLEKSGKAVRVTNGKYQTGDIMFSSSNKHVSIYIGKINGVAYRVAAENHKTGVGYFKIGNKKFTNVYRIIK